MKPSGFRRVVSAALIVPFFVASTLTASAQPAAPPPSPAASAAAPLASDTMAAGMVDGEMFAEGVRTGGRLATGLAVGALTGIIGTGIGFFATGPEAMTPEAHLRYASRSPEYQLGFKTGWEKKTQTKKRNAFLAGGLLGTAAFVAVLLSANAGAGQ